jgi:Arc/MetJ-type ribon-helix-helix transcriptional regulator
LVAAEEVDLDARGSPRRQCGIRRNSDVCGLVSELPFSPELQTLSDTPSFSGKVRPEGPPPFPLQLEASVARRTIRLTAKTNERVQSAAKQRGYSNPSAFLRAAIEKELGDRDDGIIGAEERLAATIEQVRREMFR